MPLRLEKATNQERYLSEIVEWLSDREHLRYSNQRFKDHTIESQKKFLDKILNEGDHYYYGFDGEELVGTITILEHKPHSTAEMGILVSSKLNGKGIGKKLFALATEHAMINLKFDKLRAGCLAKNIPMIRVLESCGFSWEATFYEEELHFGIREDVVFFSKHKARN